MLKNSYIKTLLYKSTVLFLQEYWLSDGQLSKLGVSDDSFCYSCFWLCYLSGRTIGGCTIFWSSAIKATVKVIESNSRRIYSIRIVTSILKILFINVYMPNGGDYCMTYTILSN